MELSVVIVNYKVRYFLELCLQSVQDAIVDLDAEIIVVDNASSDDSCSMVRHKFPSMTRNCGQWREMHGQLREGKDFGVGNGLERTC